MSTRVEAMVCHAPGEPLKAAIVEMRDPRPDEVVIEIMASGLCHSDLHQISGASAPFPFPVIVGHEGAGVVRHVGSACTTVRPGDHVIPLTIGECGVCDNCKSPETNLCEAFLATLGQPQDVYSLNGVPVSAYSGAGTLARYVLMKEMNVAKIRKDIPFELACLAGCAVATGIGAVTHTAKVTNGSIVCVFGLGGIGMNVVQGARLAGASQIIGIDRNRDRGADAEKFGLTHFIDASRTADAVSDIRKIAPAGVDFAFECIGNVSVMAQAVEATRIGNGCCTILGVPPDGELMSIPPFSIQLGRTVRGSFLGNIKTRSQLPGLLDLWADGQIDLASLVTHRLPMSQANKGFQLMQSGDAVRVVLTFEN